MNLFKFEQLCKQRLSGSKRVNWTFFGLGEKEVFFLGGYLCVKKGCKKVICTGNVLKKGAKKK